MNWTQLPLDLGKLKVLSDGDMDFALELLQIYHDDCCPHLQSLREGVATHHYEQIYEAAHYIVGSSSNIGAIQTLSAARQIELLSRSQEDGPYEAALEQIEDHLAKIRHWLQTEGRSLTQEDPQV